MATVLRSTSNLNHYYVYLFIFYWSKDQHSLNKYFIVLFYDNIDIYLLKE